MTEQTTPKKRGRKKKVAEEEATEIAVAVAKPKPKKNTEAVIPEVPPKTEEVLVAPKKPIEKSVKVKALVSVRGSIGKYNYQLQEGQIYTFPRTVAENLINSGRCI
jgi:hypothetical protein